LTLEPLFCFRKQCQGSDLKFVEITLNHYIRDIVPFVKASSQFCHATMVSKGKFLGFMIIQQGIVQLEDIL